MNTLCFKPDAYVGIDPGIKKAEPGAAALLYNGGFEIFDWKSEKDSADKFRNWSARFNIGMVAIERQWMRISDSNRSRTIQIGKLLINYGTWKGICLSNLKESQIIYPTPKEWQRGIIFVLKGQNPKDLYLAEARKYWANAPLKLKKHSGRAAALWLANYARRHYKLHEALITRTDRNRS